MLLELNERLSKYGKSEGFSVGVVEVSWSLNMYDTIWKRDVCCIVQIHASAKEYDISCLLIELLNARKLWLWKNDTRITFCFCFVNLRKKEKMKEKKRERWVIINDWKKGKNFVCWILNSFFSFPLGSSSYFALDLLPSLIDIANDNTACLWNNVIDSTSCVLKGVRKPNIFPLFS